MKLGSFSGHHWESQPLSNPEFNKKNVVSTWQFSLHSKLNVATENIHANIFIRKIMQLT